MNQHEVDIFRSDFFGCDDKVTFILSVLIIYNNDKFAFFEVLDCIVYSAEWEFLV